MSSEYCYRKILVVMMILMHESVLTVLESLDGADTESKLLDTSCFDDIGLHFETTEELLTLIRAASNLVQNPEKITFFHSSTL